MDRERVSLSLKATQEAPWQHFARTHTIGQVAPGKVTKLVPFGAFVRVEEGIEGLVHISELAERHIEMPEQIVQVGDDIYVKVIDIDLERRRISLSLKQANDSSDGVAVEEFDPYLYGMAPAFDEAGVSWLEEPFPPQDRKAYGLARTLGRVPFAAGENHYTRYEFATLLDDGDVQFIQPDLSKAGGVTESLRIAAMASAYKLTINPHTSATAINMGNTIHFLSAIDNPGYFEGDVTSLNPFRDEMMDKPAYQLDKDGCVSPYEGIEIGMKINLDFVKAHPLIDGPCYV